MPLQEHVSLGCEDQMIVEVTVMLQANPEEVTQSPMWPAWTQLLVRIWRLTGRKWGSCRGNATNRNTEQTVFESQSKLNSLSAGFYSSKCENTKKHWGVQHAGGEVRTATYSKRLEGPKHYFFVFLIKSTFCYWKNWDFWKHFSFIDLLNHTQRPEGVWFGADDVVLLA